ncbi:MAG TPA: glycosyltransferase family 1 protein [Desulfuromonadales bacterium]
MNGGETARPSALRIALVSETWFPQVNGVSRSLEKLVESLTACGDTVRLFIPRYPESHGQDGLSVVGFRAVPLPFYPEVRLPLVTPATVARELASFRPDVVHIATEGPLGWAALRAAQNLTLPVVSSYHTSFAHYLRLYGAGWLEGAAWRYLRGFHNATAATFCPTPSIRDQLREKGFERVEIWSRGVNCVNFHPGKRDGELRRQLGLPENAVVLACCGRLAAEKNLETLLAAFRRLPTALPVNLLLIGDGPLRPKLEAAAADPRVIFAGYRRGEELARIYASADLFVFPSLSDTFGNVLLEAMASGLPAVAFDVPGPRDVVRHGETGLLVGKIGAEGLAAALAALIADPARLAGMSAQALRYAAGQNWEAINSVVRRRYLEVVGAAARQREHPQTAPGKGVQPCP